MVKLSDFKSFLGDPKESSAFELRTQKRGQEQGVDHFGAVSELSRLNTIEMLGLLDDPRSHPELKNNVRRFLAERLVGLREHADARE